MRAFEGGGEYWEMFRDPALLKRIRVCPRPRPRPRPRRPQRASRRGRAGGNGGRSFRRMRRAAPRSSRGNGRKRRASCTAPAAPPPLRRPRARAGCSRRGVAAPGPVPRRARFLRRRRRGGAEQVYTVRTDGSSERWAGTVTRSAEEAAAAVSVWMAEGLTLLAGEEGARTRLEAGWCAADGERVAVSREFEGGALAAVRFVRERRVGGAP